jgi:hypothetical protein
MDGSPMDEVKQSLVKLAVIAGQMDARSQAALHRIEASANLLDRSALSWTEGAGDFARQALDAIGAQARDSVATETRRALAPLEAQLRQSTEAARWAATALAEQRALLGRAQRALVWKGLLALLLGSLLAAGGCGYAAWYSARTIALGEDITQALHSGALARCEDNRSLCVRVGTRPRHPGGRAQYVVVQPQEPGQ